jgi:CYTH domain-containing protein
MIESERSWLVRTPPPLDGVATKKIAQHYLSKSPDGTIRLRRTGEEYELTKKTRIAGGDVSRRQELNVPLTREEYELFLPLAKNGLRKTRHLIPLEGGQVAEYDVFEGPLAGLVKVEVEFADDAARAAFVPPGWFGREITAEPWSLNAELAGRSWKDIEHLAKQ